MRHLKDKTAIVTGGASGIGKGIVKRFLEEGSQVVVPDIDEESLEDTRRELSDYSGNTLFLKGSVTDTEFLKEMKEKTIDKFDKIDILVNNAGIIRDNYILNMPEMDWEDVIEVNLKGPFLCSKTVLEHMRKRESGKIVNIVSRAWLGNPGQANYSASKGGLVSLTRTLALEFARYKININAVAPGLIDTPMTRNMPPKAREKLREAQPTGEMGTIEDVASAVAFLSSGDADFVTGQVLYVDGGKSTGLVP